MSNSLEQFNQLELSANFTPPERRYFDKLKAEYRELYAGRTLEQIGEEDVVALRQIEAKIVEIKKFVQDRKMEKEVWDRERLDSWVKNFELEKRLTDEWIDKNISFLENGAIVCKCSLYLPGTAITYLPDDLTVKGSLDLYRCSSLTSLPDSLEVGGDLNLFGCSAVVIEMAYKLKKLGKIKGEIIEKK